MQKCAAIDSTNIFRGLFYIFIFCLVLPLLTSCESQKTIVNGLDEKEANEIVVFLSTKGINATKVKVEAAGGGGGKLPTYDIQVSEKQGIEAMALLNQAGLPRRRSQSLLGIFSNAGSLVPSEMQEKVRYQAGLAEQIASTIRKIDGVLDAEVQISFPEEDPLTGKTKGKITASVFVKHNGVLDDPNSHLITKIKRFVASSVTGLDYDNVTVIPVLARNAEYTGPALTSEGQEKQYVSVWTIILAKESLTRFRIIFFSLILLVLLLILALVWLSWKMFPLIKERGGIRELFHLHPISGEKIEEKPAEEAKKESADKEGKTSEEEGLVDKDIDET